jgi:hypothetical protein
VEAISRQAGRQAGEAISRHCIVPVAASVPTAVPMPAWSMSPTSDSQNTRYTATKLLKNSCGKYKRRILKPSLILYYYYYYYFY